MGDTVPRDVVTPDAIIARIEGRRKYGRGWLGRCPAHHDRSPSLSVRVADDGKVLLRCFAGCRIEEITAALGISVRDLFPPRGNGQERRPRPRPRSELDQARLDVVRTARHQQQRLAPYRTLFATADAVREGFQSAAAGRRAATSRGDAEESWELLAAVAALECDALSVEAELDELLAEKRLP
jgi:hypothetical protein